MGSWNGYHWLITLGICYVIWRFFRRDSSAEGSSSASPRPKVGAFVWPKEDFYHFEVVGEANYQKGLQRLAGAHADQGADIEVTALLHLENTNAYDDKAVRVDIDGLTVGYLSRQDARSYRRRLSAKKLGQVDALCSAMIVGGFVTRDGSRASYGVKLAIKPFE